jgi:hypothetical protein
MSREMPAGQRVGRILSVTEDERGLVAELEVPDRDIRRALLGMPGFTATVRVEADQDD